MKYLLVGVLIYFIVSRILRIGAAVKQDSTKNPESRSTKKKPKDNHGGEYVDYEEIE